MAGLLQGKTAIVTGAGDGVGLAIARTFLKAGAKVMLTDPSEDALDRALEDLDDTAGAAAHFGCNLEERLAVNNLLAATQDAFGALDILVNAKVTPERGHFLDLSPETFASSQAYQVGAVFQLSQAVVKRMIAQREANADFNGAIVNVTSIAARRTVPELFAHSVACAALDQLTRSMASCLARHRIRVNAVALGAIMTTRLREALREREGLREEMVRVTPIGRIGEAEEAAEAALFLASDRASFITGQILAVDGGRTVLDPLASPER